MDEQAQAAMDEGVDAAQRDAFMQRAMAESRRMSSEAAKSDQKRKELYEEMGMSAASMASMTREHMEAVQAAAQAEQAAQAEAGQDASQATQVD